MSVRIYSERNYRQLMAGSYKPGALPRRTRYGTDECWQAGLTPVEDQTQVDLLEWADLKEVIETCHQQKRFAEYHQRASWAPDARFRYNQNGIGYCWTWSGTAAVMDCRESEGKDAVPLAPVSMGWLVNWKDRGNYLESFIRGAREVGIAPAEFVDGNINSHNRNPSSYQPGWETERKKYRLDEVWDTDCRRNSRTTILHCATILSLGKPLYIAYNWWGHALECVSLRWDERLPNNIGWRIRNSHNEDDLIELTGSRGEPDEAYGFVSTVLAA